MKKLALPESWRDLSPVELVALLTRRPPFVTRLDLLLAQWDVAESRAADARDAEASAWDAERAAYHVWMQKRDGRSLTAYERAKDIHRRDDAARRRAEARADQLFKLATEPEA
ncbi:hypothetical protein [Bosea sp. (in: a-proteobacteria)]|jgi:hypothetical protein|uniref:hypothetical protein n=1 Tax=Bosea sp. (in: a-proteobacteria) TaxID=1871050 RepID=UPI00356B4B34